LTSVPKTLTAQTRAILTAKSKEVAVWNALKTPTAQFSSGEVHKQAELTVMEIWDGSAQILLVETAQVLYVKLMLTAPYPLMVLPAHTLRISALLVCMTLTVLEQPLLVLQMNKPVLSA